MSQLQRLLAAQDGECFFCGRKLTQRSGAVTRLPGAISARADSMSLVCCRKTAERLIDFEAKERLIALLNPMENMLCTRKGIDTGSESKPTSGTGLSQGGRPRANADLCPPRPVNNEQLHAHSPYNSGQGRPLLFTRCTVCDAPAIPGDSLCYTHNR